MKKLLVVLMALLMLVGCSQKEEHKSDLQTALLNTEVMSITSMQLPDIRLNTYLNTKSRHLSGFVVLLDAFLCYNISLIS